MLLEALPVKQNVNQNCLRVTQVAHAAASQLWEEADSASRALKSATSTWPINLQTYLIWAIQNKNPLLNAYTPKGSTEEMWISFIPARGIKAIRRSQSACPKKNHYQTFPSAKGKETVTHRSDTRIPAFPPIRCSFSAILQLLQNIFRKTKIRMGQYELINRCTLKKLAILASPSLQRGTKLKQV